MTFPEILNWMPAAKLPDSDTTVILHDPDASEPVWLGYYDGESWWYIDGHKAKPKHWADMPGGPSK